MNFGGSDVFFSFSSERDKSVFLAGEVIIRNERSGGTLETSDFEVTGEEASQAESRIFGSVFLIIRGFVGLVDNDKTKVFNRSKKGGTRANDDGRFFCLEGLLPELMADSFGLGGMQ